MLVSDLSQPFPVVVRGQLRFKRRCGNSMPQRHAQEHCREGRRTCVVDTSSVVIPAVGYRTLDFRSISFTEKL